MAYYDVEKNVTEYINLAEGYDGRDFIPILQTTLKNGSTVLELGMGPGKDFELLSEYFQVTGSDNSKIFLDRFRATHPDAEVVWLDAVSLDIDRKFDCIYSNKVLHHLSKSELNESFKNQAKILNSDGFVFHTFWYGDTEEEYSGLRFVYYTPETLLEVIGDRFDEISVGRYTEMEDRDSFYIVLQKR